MIACVSPSQTCTAETSKTLRYAQRARRIKNRPVIHLSDPKEELIAQLKRDLRAAKMEGAALRAALGGESRNSARDSSSSRASNRYLPSLREAVPSLSAPNLYNMQAATAAMHQNQYYHQPQSPYYAQSPTFQYNIPQTHHQQYPMYYYSPPNNAQYSQQAAISSTSRRSHPILPNIMPQSGYSMNDINNLNESYQASSYYYYNNDASATAPLQQQQSLNYSQQPQSHQNYPQRSLSYSASTSQTVSQSTRSETPNSTTSTFATSRMTTPSIIPKPPSHQISSKKTNRVKR